MLLMKKPAKHHTHALLQAKVVTATAVTASYLLYRALKTRRKTIPTPLLFRLSSPAFDAGGSIPETYTCKGKNLSPPLEFAGIPEHAGSLALIVRDPDSPGGNFIHWTVWNINPDTTNIIEGRVPTGAVEGRNDFGQVGYGGPCPLYGTHQYKFELYALDDNLDLPPGAGHQSVQDVIEAHAIGKTELTGTVSASQSQT